MFVDIKSCMISLYFCKKTKLVKNKIHKLSDIIQNLYVFINILQRTLLAVVNVCDMLPDNALHYVDLHLYTNSVYFF